MLFRCQPSRLFNHFYFTLCYSASFFFIWLQSPNCCTCAIADPFHQNLLNQTRFYSLYQNAFFQHMHMKTRIAIVTTTTTDQQALGSTIHCHFSANLIVSLRIKFGTLMKLQAQKMPKKEKKRKKKIIIMHIHMAIALLLTHYSFDKRRQRRRRQTTIHFLFVKKFHSLFHIFRSFGRSFFFFSFIRFYPSAE